MLFSFMSKIKNPTKTCLLLVNALQVLITNQCLKTLHQRNVNLRPTSWLTIQNGLELNLDNETKLQVVGTLQHGSQSLESLNETNIEI